MKLDKTVLANTFALTTAILWAVCSIIVWLLPKFTLSVTKWWMHGLNISSMGSWDLNPANFILGGTTLIISAWASGWIFGFCWEKLSSTTK